MSDLNLSGYYVLYYSGGMIQTYAGPFTKVQMNDYISQRPDNTYQVLKADHCYEIKIGHKREEVWREFVDAKEKKP